MQRHLLAYYKVAKQCDDAPLNNFLKNTNQLEAGQLAIYTTKLVIST